jgi:hypothetical protein
VKTIDYPKEVNQPQEKEIGRKNNEKIKRIF